MIPKTKNEIWIDAINAFLSYQGKLTDVSIRSEFGKMLRSFSLEAEELYNAIHDALLSRSAKYSVGDDLRVYVQDFLKALDDGSYWKKATEATVIIRFFGTAETSVSGIIVQKNESTYRYESESDKTGTINDDGYVDMNYIAVSPGKDYRADVNQIQEFSTSPPEGIDSCTNLLKTTGGEDEETDDELRYRLLQFWDDLARGTKGAIESAAITVPGVRYAKMLDNYPSIGEDTLIVADSFGIISEALISATIGKVTNYQAGGRPYLTISNANIAGIFLQSYATLRDNYLIENVRPDYDTAVRKFVNVNLTFGSHLYPNNFQILVDGIWAITDIKLSLSLDPWFVPGIEVQSFVWNNEIVLSENKFELPFFYNASSRDIVLDNQQIYIGDGGEKNITLSAKAGIATLVLNVFPNFLSTSDKYDSFVFHDVTNNGINLSDKTLAVVKSIQLDQIKKSIINV